MINLDDIVYSAEITRYDHEKGSAAKTALDDMENEGEYIPPELGIMSKNIQLLTLQEFARKYGIKNPYDKSDYDYIYAYKNNITPDINGNWPKRRDND